MSSWIAITEREPEPDTTVLLFDPTNPGAGVWIGHRTACYCAGLPCYEQHGDPCSACHAHAADGTWYRFDYGDQDPPARPTHWMPMPEPPRDDEYHIEAETTADAETARLIQRFNEPR